MSDPEGEDWPAAAGDGYSPATDPRGLVGADGPPDSHVSTGAAVRSTADMTPEERAYNRNLYGLTYRERYGAPKAGCVCYCVGPGQRRRGVRCPACYGTVEIRALTEAPEVEPGATKAERFAAWVGGWVGAFLDAVMFPFRVGRAHHEAMTRDILRDALNNGLQVEALTDILAALEGIEGELRAIRDATDKTSEALCQDGSSTR